MNLKVTKRNGKIEDIDLDKIHQVIEWAADGLSNVSVSEVELKSHIQFYDKMKTSDIHLTMIKSAADLISEEAPNNQYLAARLQIFHLRKKAYGQFTAPSVFSHVKKMVKMGKYDKELMIKYTENEFNEMNNNIVHSRDLDFSYAAVKQLEGKYLVQNRVTDELYESPQMAYMLIAATLFSNYKKEQRMTYIVKFYNAISTFKISLPTPIMAGVRTPTRQFSSCVLIDCDDTLDSISATSAAIIRYVSQRAGIGINAGKIRALGSKIRNGEAIHTGVIPFFKHFQTAVKSCSQGGIRGGAATLFYPFWHLEVESLLVLKNNRGVEENRVRKLDYGVQLNKLMYTRLITGGVITLFSPSEVPKLYESFFADQNLFEKLYVKYENDDNIRKKQVKAVDLFCSLMQERSSTGRIYIQNVDHCNTHSPFDPSVAPIRQSNLCLEIALPTKPINNVDDPNGEVALCTISALNVGLIDSEEEMEELTSLIVKALNELLDYQDYPLPAAKKASMNRRTLGIGVIGYAHHLAKKGKKYSDGSANDLTHKMFESLQYFLLKASMELSKEKGPCPLFSETTYSKGILPIDTYKRDIDKFCTTELKHDWEALRKDIVKHGLRNSTLTALMPSETSSQISNATNGIEPPRGFISVKESKDGILKQVVPDFLTLKDSYELLWSIPNNNGYLQLVGIMQKFVDQSISANTNYDPSKTPNGKIEMKVLLGDLLTAYKYGLKTLYYQNTRDDAQDIEEDECGGACKI